MNAPKLDVGMKCLANVRGEKVLVRLTRKRIRRRGMEMIRDDDGQPTFEFACENAAAPAIKYGWRPATTLIPAD